MWPGLGRVGILGSRGWPMISWWILSNFLDLRVSLLIDLMESEASEESDPLGAIYPGRAGLVAGCYLVRHGMSGEERINEINMLMMEVLADQLHSPETEDPRSMVLNWKG